MILSALVGILTLFAYIPIRLLLARQWLWAIGVASLPFFVGPYCAVYHPMIRRSLLLGFLTLAVSIGIFVLRSLLLA